MAIIQASRAPAAPTLSSSASAIEVRGLRRTYGRGPSAYEAVRGVDLEVAAGSITALLGTNGAGKTSTLEVIEGLAPATGGTVSVLGLDPVADRGTLRRRTGVLLQRSGFSGDLTVRETLRQWGGTLTAPRPVDEMLALLSLHERADVRMLALSGGEARRVEVACALMGSPELVILDEPTTGLDPESRRAVWRVVSDLRDGGATVLLTTHYLEEAEALADRLEIMHAGRIVRSGTPDEIAEGHPSTITFSGAEDLPRDLAGVTRIVRDHGRTTLETDALQRSLLDLLSWAQHHEITLEHLDARTASLEAVFLSIADGTEPGSPR
ncbi:ABC transporter ATP-binding protein [Solirubrobacter sp. CPCC 204708]|uniref:ABC transporter ATP-binding protein n=1 Tax=Solirubrobacter deserti TaxID=2282478 RepID=A0ABT4RUK3_9ACTN|nr:ABC transporter ATP-binding protein [Solirubrobacter deserti]MBE2320969.1 ABC transporter ATP-binding protein [Solirubrobacter deserti]MDA0142263.1 ABC transporter ATP-binding protein [Solirubrobacter deserti]